MKKAIRAAIFDMDGTLTDTMDSWRRLNLSFVHEHGVVPDAQQEAELYGMSGMMVVEYLKEQFGIEASFDRLLERSVKKMGEVYEQGVALKPGAMAFLRRLRADGVKTVLATATPARYALIALNGSGLTQELDYIFSTEMLGLKKNDPACFDRICALIGEKNEDCVMFEDALYAMKGARASGLDVIGITDETNLRDRDAMHAVCSRVIDSYDELKEL